MAVLIEARSEIGRAGLPVVSAGVRLPEPGAFSGGGKLPPRRPTTFADAGGIFPEDYGLGEVREPEQTRREFISVWENRLSEETRTQGTMAIMREVSRVGAVLGDLLSKTGISRYGVDHLKQVAFIALATGGSPSELLPVEVLQTETTFIQERYSSLAEMGLIKHFIEHPELYPNYPEAVLTAKHNEWFNDMMSV